MSEREQLTDPVGAGTPGVLRWASEVRALPGETTSGDGCLVSESEGGALIAVVDGLGHGPAAAEARERALEALEPFGFEAPLGELVAHCHGRLRATRGVALSLMSIDVRRARLSWVGIGNVEGLLLRSERGLELGMRARGASLRSRESIVSQGGIVGYRMPTPRVMTHPIARGDLLILGTDGLTHDFADDLRAQADPADIARDIMKRAFKETDDALVLVGRYEGPHA